MPSLQQAAVGPRGSGGT